ncbi:MAG: GntR family transcriptional regulator [Kiritimatiellaeota bacterium]|nr:GntR family transcriptional regulator [Kiritimatiellota bacterium]
MPKTKINKAALADVVEKRIHRYISRHGLRSGDALPKEIHFAKSFGVTRNVVREALSRLRMLGLIESKKKRGMILAHPDILAGLERMARLDVLDRETEKGLFELRLVLELGLTDLIYLRKTQKDIDDLRRLVRGEKRFRNNPVIPDALDIAFHVRLYRIADNALINRLLNVINSFFKICNRYGLEHMERKPSPLHADLLSALERGNIRQFREKMRQHLNFYLQYICQVEREKRNVKGGTSNDATD